MSSKPVNKLEQLKLYMVHKAQGEFGKSCISRLVEDKDNGQLVMYLYIDPPPGRQAGYQRVTKLFDAQIFDDGNIRSDAYVFSKRRRISGRRTSSFFGLRYLAP